MNMRRVRWGMAASDFKKLSLLIKKSVEGLFVGDCSDIYCHRRDCPCQQSEQVPINTILTAI